MKSLLARQQAEKKKSILEELFYILDKDDSGKIFTKDLRIALFSIGIYWKKSKIDEFILNVEAAAKGSQYIDYTLFHEKFSPLLDLKPDNGQDSAFHVFDANNSGSIDLDNLIYSMETIGDPITSEDMIPLLKNLNIKDDGTINYEEFVDMMMGD